MMKEESTDKIYDLLVEQMAANDYVPGPLKDFETYKLNVKDALDAEAEKSGASVWNGFLLLSVVRGGNDRTKKLFEKFMTLNENPILQNGNLQSISKQMIENNIFGVTEEDHDLLLTHIDEIAKTENYQEAIDMYHAMTVTFPDHLESWLRWAYITGEHNFNYEKVLEIYQECAKYYDYPAVYTAMGICHVKGMDFKLAEECFHKALELCDKNHEPNLKKDVSGLLSDIKALR